MQNKVTVIVPVYNVEAFLPQCLDSIVHQTYKNLEIICINDGSTDGSEAILEEYKKLDSRIIVIKQENAGQGIARNKALDICTGDWILGVDSDDYLTNDAIERAIKHTEDRDIELVIFSARAFHGNEEKCLWETPRLLKIVAEGKTELTEHIIIDTHVTFWGKLWKKSLIDKAQVRFPERLWYEDVFFWFTVAIHCKYAYFDNTSPAFYNYRQRVDSTMGQTFNKSPRGIEHMKILYLILDYFKKHNIRKLLGYNEDTTSLIEQHLVERLYQSTISWGNPKILEEAWFYLRNIMEEFTPSQSRKNYPASQYHFYTHPRIDYKFGQLYKEITNIKKVNEKQSKKYSLKHTNEIRQLYLMLEYPSILKKYRILKLKSLFSFGRKKKEYKEKLLGYKAIIREIRANKRQFYLKFFNNYMTQPTEFR